MGILNKIMVRWRAKSIAPKSITRRFCANRTTLTYDYEDREVTVTRRNKRQPDGYSREELVGMLTTVREHERLQGWHVPEPDSDVPSPPSARADLAPLFLNVRDAGRLLRGLERLQEKLSALHSQRYASTYDRDYEDADSLLLGIGLRVAKLAGGLQNPDLIAEWKGTCPTKTEDTPSTVPTP